MTLTTLAMFAFAGNSLLCRMALRDGSIDPTSFTALRLMAGALTLYVLLRLRQGATPAAGSWWGALSLFTYAAAFSFAYVSLDAGTGALLLFGAVQLSMIIWGLLRGERLRPWQIVGLALAMGGLLILLLPGSSTPALSGALLMLLSGSAWGAYSLLGRSATDPLAATTGNFIRTLPMAALLCLGLLTSFDWTGAGVIYALLSGALTSGIGYAIWYAALPKLTAIQAASIQLSVPLLTAVAGALLLGEALTTQVIIAAGAILGGVALVLRAKYRS